MKTYKALVRLYKLKRIKPFVVIFDALNMDIALSFLENKFGKDKVICIFSEQENYLKLFKGFYWDHNDPNSMVQRIEIEAYDTLEALSKLEKIYGEKNIFHLYNEDDANKLSPDTNIKSNTFTMNWGSLV